jgi:hypothetical protein
MLGSKIDTGMHDHQLRSMALESFLSSRVSFYPLVFPFLERGHPLQGLWRNLNLACVLPGSRLVPCRCVLSPEVPLGLSGDTWIIIMLRLADRTGSMCRFGVCVSSLGEQHVFWSLVFQISSVMFIRFATIPKEHQIKQK